MVVTVLVSFISPNPLRYVIGTKVVITRAQVDTTLISFSIWSASLSESHVKTC